MKIGVNFIEYVKQFLRYQGKRLLPWQQNLIRGNSAYFHNFLKRILAVALTPSRNVSVLQIPLYIIKSAETYFTHVRALFCFHGN